MFSVGAKDRICHFVAKVFAGALMLGGRRFHNAVVRSLFEVSLEPPKIDIKIDVPPEQQPASNDAELFQRIFESFKKMKRDQQTAEALFLPSSEWQRQLDKSFAPLQTSLEADDISDFSYFLANFGVWPEYIGIESGSLLRRAAKFPSTRHQLIHNFGLHLDWWDKCERNGRCLSTISYPRFGNQSGMKVNECFVGLGSMGNDYFARNIANNLSSEHPKILEVGGGYGKLFYFLNRALRGRIKSYVDIDLPEVLCCCAYYMAKCFPERSLLLYGEYDLAAKHLPEADIILIPGWELKKVPTNFADIFINKNSLGEMAPDTAAYFVQECCKRANSFWHMNHESYKYRFENGQRSLINGEYPVPESWTLVSRVPDPLNAMVTRGSTTEIYEYYFVAPENDAQPQG